MDLTQLSSNLKVKTDFNAGSSLGLRDINSITGIVDNSVTSLQALIFPTRNAENDDRNPTRFDVTGITSGYDSKCFVFDIKKEYKYNLSSDITDHYVEDNIAIQDHIGLKPIILEVSGCIGEVNLKDKLKEQSDLDKYLSEQTNKNIFNSIDSYLSRMGSLTSFAPNIVNQALDIYNTTKFGYSTVSKIINLDKKDSKATRRFAYNSEYDEEVIKQTKQFEWINWFKTQWWNRASFSIVTPYEVLDSMYIMDLSASQPENSRYVTNLNIKFKQIRKAKVILKEKKQVSQPMDTRRYRTGRDGLPPTTVIDDIGIWKKEEMNVQYTASDGIKKYSTTAMSEIEEVKYKQSLNVPSKTGKLTEENIENNIKMIGSNNVRAILSQA